MMDMEFSSLASGYATIVQCVLADGEEVSPRGIRTKEVRGATLKFLDPSKSLPVGTGRKLRTQIGAAEAMQLIGGFSDARMMTSITKNFVAFVEDGRLRGAYGPRVHGQFPRMIELLKRDPDTRQACLIVWRPWEIASPSKDVPCTLHLQFLLREGKLNMIATMRSNDVFWGLPYDAWVFANVQYAVAYALAVDVGWYVHHAGSLHAYVDRDLDALNALHDYDGKAEFPPMFVSPTRLQECSGDRAVARWNRVSLWARYTAGLPGRKGGDGQLLPESCEWYRSTLARHTAKGILCNSCRYVLPRDDEHFWDGVHHMNSTRCRLCRTLPRHGLTYDEYQGLLAYQKGVCAICKEDDGRDLVIDHDHDTGRVRGLLCRGCNVGIGMLGEGDHLHNAIDYLSEPEV